MFFIQPLAATRNALQMFNDSNDDVLYPHKWVLLLLLNRWDGPLERWLNEPGRKGI